MNESILMTTSKYQKTGGHNVVITNLSNEIQKLGYNVTIGAFSFKEKPPDGIEQLKIKCGLLHKKNWSKNFDLIHNHETKLNYYSLMIKNPFVFHYHGTMGKIQKINLEVSLKLSYKHIHGIIAVSDSALKDILENVGEKIFSEVIYNGVDSQFFNVNEFQDFRKGEQQLIFVGNLVNYKNIAFLIDSIKELKKEFPKIHLQIIGDGIENENLTKKIKNFNLVNNIELVGKINSREEIRSRYLSSDVYVSASIFEACPLPPLEAMACGIPVLLSNIPAHKELIDKSNGGMNFSLTQKDDIIKKISILFQKKKDFGVESKIFAQKNDWKIVAKKISSIYSKIL